MFRSIVFLGITLLLYNSSQVNCINNFKLELDQNGGYNNILVAINPEIGGTNCDVLVQEIQRTISTTSQFLYEAAGVYFSNVKILIPITWQSNCAGTSAEDASASIQYSIADFKVTNSHPLAASLPYTRQYKGCGEGAEDIFIPANNFLLSSSFDQNTKSKILLHEWAKFRYGVFEEFGYFEDQVYSPCYKQNGQTLFTSCADSALPPISSNVETNCRSGVESATSSILESFKASSSSIMSMPHLENIGSFCDNSTHNKFAWTKQNVHCFGRSVMDVLENHKDFKQFKAAENQRQTPPTTTFTILKHPNFEYSPGYFFILEDSTLIREQGRLRFVKQAITSIVDLLPLNSVVGLCQFEGGAVISRQTWPLTSDLNKQEFVQKLSDLKSLTLQQKINQSGLLDTVLGRQVGAQNINVAYILESVISYTNSMASYNWQLYLVTNSPSNSIEEAKAVLRAGGVTSLTIATFEETLNPAWLQLYEEPVLKNFIPLPYNCLNEAAAACTHLSHYMVDDFVDTMRAQQRTKTKYWNKVAESLIQSGSLSTLRISSPFPSPISRAEFRFFISVPMPLGNLVVVRNPRGVTCRVGNVHGYEYLARVLDCDLEAGEWTIDLSLMQGTNIFAQVSIYVESSQVLYQVFTTLEGEKSVEIAPNGHAIPIYARVTDEMERPIINAKVHVERVFPPTTTNPSLLVSLFDDGKGPDMTKDDGVYTAYFRDFSNAPAYHLAQVVVSTTNSESTVVTSIRQDEAALLDSRMGGKCCGSVVPVSSTASVSTSRITSMIPGFKTREGFDAGSLPPTRIGFINTITDDGESLTLEFAAPGFFNGDRVQRYDSCCISAEQQQNDEVSSCHPLECVPVSPGFTQTCIAQRNVLARNHLGSEQSNLPSKIFLACTLRGVSLLGVPGLESVGRLEIDVGGKASSKSGECKSISDDCLPIAVFWGLIGALGGLLLIILALIICWCLSSRKKNQSSTEKKQEVLMSKNRVAPNRLDIEDTFEKEATRPSTILPPNDSPSYNVFVNKAYIQDNDGQMKLVAADGQLLPFDGESISDATTIMNEPISYPHSSSIVPVPPLRRKSLVERVYPTAADDINDPVQLRRDMTIYKSLTPFADVKPRPPPKPSKAPGKQLKMGERPYISEPIPIPMNRAQRPESGYANGNPDYLPQNNNNDNPSVHEMEVDVMPVYASVNRNGRKTPTVVPDPISARTPNISNGFSTFRPKPSPKAMLPPEFYSRSVDDSNLPRNQYQQPVPTQTQSTRFVGPNKSRPSSTVPAASTTSPKRLDGFPSSESDTYSDMSRGNQTKPPQPPPFPSSQIPSKPKTNPNAPRYRSSEPPKYQPPPPPVPQRQPNKGGVEEDYYDDSDNWEGEDEDFDFQNPGHSFA